MEQIEKYLKNTFGMIVNQVPLEAAELNKLPVYMRNFGLFSAKINNQRLIFVTTGDYAQLTTADFKRRAELIEKNLNIPVVLVLDKLEAYKRSRLIEKKIAFIVPGKQLYIPFLLIEFKEYKNKHNKKKERLTPAAQCLLFYYLLGNNIEGINFKTLAEKLNYSTMTITRAANELKELALAEITGGKEKYLQIIEGKKTTWKKALPYLSSPVEKIIYVEHTDLAVKKFMAGINALAEYTSITGEYRKTFAIPVNSLIKLKNEPFYGVIHEPEEDTGIIQVWKYDPGLLAANNVVDPLSLFLSLQNTGDERVDKELDLLLENLW